MASNKSLFKNFNDLNERQNFINSKEKKTSNHL
jgi:hypothetical protein